MMIGKGHRMALHNWVDLPGWEGVHDIWLVELLRCIKPQLPQGYRAHLGTTPAVAIDAPDGKPDVAVRHWENGSDRAAPSTSELTEPDVATATFAIDPNVALIITYHGQLAAAVEIISPRNKDRPASRATYLARYLGYLKWQVNLMLVDVHPEPAGFSFADALAAELGLKEPPLPSPMAVAYRIGGRAPDGGSFVEMWKRPLAAGQPLPKIPLPLSATLQVQVDLDATYSRAAADAYLG
jgi:hypothetical protein